MLREVAAREHISISVKCWNMFALVPSKGFHVAFHFLKEIQQIL